MKFTKEQAVEKLNQILTNGGKKPLRMSERTLSGQTETLMALIADDEMELDDFVEKVKVTFESVNSNIEHDVSESIKEYREQHPNQPNPPTPPNPPIPPEGDMAELMRRLKTLESAEEERKNSAALDAKRVEIKKYLSDNHVKDKGWIDMALSTFPIGAEDNVEDKGKSILEFYNKTLAAGGPGVPGAPNPGGGGGLNSDSFAEVKTLRKQSVEMMK